MRKGRAFPHRALWSCAGGNVEASEEVTKVKRFKPEFDEKAAIALCIENA